jgi:hypothetical protein
MQKGDLSVAVEIERQANLHVFDVFGIGECQALEPFAWRECDYLAAIRQYRCKSRGMFDTRAYVAAPTRVSWSLIRVCRPPSPQESWIPATLQQLVYLRKSYRRSNVCREKSTK